MLKWIQSFGNKQEEKLPPPPKGSIRTRCYRLNLDAPIILSVHDHHKLIDVEQGPITYEPPSHLLPSSSSPSSSSSTSSKRKQHRKENEIFRTIINAIPSNDSSLSSFSSNNNNDDDDSEYKSAKDMAIQTARIFRDLEVDEKGIIRSKNELETRNEKKWRQKKQN